LSTCYAEQDFSAGALSESAERLAGCEPLGWKGLATDRERDDPAHHGTGGIAVAET